MIWDNDYAISLLPQLLEGLWVTVQVTVLGMAIALVVGMVFAILRFMRIPLLSPLLTFVVLFVRGTPLLVQAYLVFFMLPAYGIRLSPFVVGVLVIGINYSAYTAEVYRSGIEGVARGQWEAATALASLAASESPPSGTHDHSGARELLDPDVQGLRDLAGHFIDGTDRSRQTDRLERFPLS